MLSYVGVWLKLLQIVLMCFELISAAIMHLSSRQRKQCENPCRTNCEQIWVYGFLIKAIGRKAPLNGGFVIDWRSTDLCLPLSLRFVYECGQQSSTQTIFWVCFTWTRGFRETVVVRSCVETGAVSSHSEGWLRLAKETALTRASAWASTWMFRSTMTGFAAQCAITERVLLGWRFFIFF